MLTMRNREEFKALIEEKKKRYYAQRRRKRIRLLAVLVPSAACAALCCGMLAMSLHPLPLQMPGESVPQDTKRTNPVISDEAEKPDGLGTQSTPLYDGRPAVVSAQVTSLPVSDAYEGRYTDPQKAGEIAAYFDGLTLSDMTDGYADTSAGMSLIVTITYQDGSTRTYVHFGNRYLRIDGGSWKQMRYEEAVELGNLIERLPFDEGGRKK